MQFYEVFAGAIWRVRERERERERARERERERERWMDGDDTLLHKDCGLVSVKPV